MNKATFNLRKLYANVLSSVIFWDKYKRKSFRAKFHPTSAKNCVKYLSRYAKGIETENKECKHGKYIWTCWLQGEDNAPELVKKCFQSLREYKPQDFELKIITYDNLNDYISLPEFIIEKHRKHIISNTHLSDIIRLYLLKEYGGFWIDATCLLTSPLPQYIYNSEFFIYRSVGKYTKTLIQSCFIYSKSFNPLISKWAEAITKYWENENFLLEYFVCHYLFIALLENDIEFKNLYESYSLNETEENMHIILRSNKEKISDTDFKNVCQKTFIHKLSYKENIELPI